MAVEAVTLDWESLGFTAGMSRNHAAVPTTRQLLINRMLDPYDPHQLFRFTQGAYKLTRQLADVNEYVLREQLGDVEANSHLYLAERTIWWYRVMRHSLGALVPTQDLQSGTVRIDGVEVGLFGFDDWHSYDLVERVDAAYKEFIALPDAAPVVVGEDPYFYDAAYCLFHGAVCLAKAVQADIQGAKRATAELRHSLRLQFRENLPFVHPEVMDHIIRYLC